MPSEGEFILSAHHYHYGIWTEIISLYGNYPYANNVYSNSVKANNVKLIVSYKLAL